MTTSKRNINVYFVEDDLPFGNVLKTFLELNQYRVNWISDGSEAIKQFEANKYDIAILDVMLPGSDGFNVAQHIRSQQPTLPFVFMTAKSMKEDILKGYKTGADDYITKPFDTEVLLLKLDAILKRVSGSGEQNEGSLTIGSIELNIPRRQLSGNNVDIRLSPRECELLHLLALNMNQFVPRTTILEKLWGDDDYFTRRSMDVFIAKLRKHLSADPNITLESVQRGGYILKIENS